MLDYKCYSQHILPAPELQREIIEMYYDLDLVHVPYLIAAGEVKPDFVPERVAPERFAVELLQKDFQLDGNRVMFCLSPTHGGAYLIFPSKEEGSYDYWKQRYVEEPFIYKDHYIIYDEVDDAVNVYKLVKVEV